MTKALDPALRLRSTVWNHRNFESALGLALALATYSPKGEMILITGPSGAGKTTLLNNLLRTLTGPAETWPEGTLPVITAPICNDVQGLFNSKNFCLRLLDAAQHPFYGYRRPAMSNSDVHPALALEKIRLRYSEPHLRLALEMAIEHRGTKYILLDEAQHLLKSGSEKQAINNLDSIKVLAERTGAIVFLLGTFEILPIWNRSAQLNRRLQDVVLNRYHADKPEDLEEFARILDGYGRLLPLHPKISLIREAEFLYESTFGIIGELARLFTGACARRQAASSAYITSKMLRESAHSEAKLETLRREALGGEYALSGVTEAPERPVVDVSVPRRSAKPGRRNPARDRVGRV